jgi:hypothetical protein
LWSKFIFFQKSQNLKNPYSASIWPDWSIDVAGKGVRGSHNVPYWYSRMDVLQAY